MDTETPANQSLGPLTQIKIQKHHLILVKTHLNTTLIGLIKDKQAKYLRLVPKHQEGANALNFEFSLIHKGCIYKLGHRDALIGSQGKLVNKQKYTSNLP